MKNQFYNILSLSLAFGFTAFDTKAEEKAAPLPGAAAKAKPSYVKAFEKGEIKFKAEDLMRVEGVPLGGATPSEQVQIIFTHQGRNYLYLNNGSFIPTSEDRLFELSEKYMASNSKKAYEEKLHAFEKKQDEASKRMDELEDKSENKGLTPEKLEAKLKPEIDKLEASLKIEAKKVQYTFDTQGNLVIGGNQILINRYKDLLADKNAEFKQTLISSTDISRGRMMEHAAMSMGEMGVDNIQKIIVVYSSKPGSTEGKNLVYDLQKLQATKDGKPIDFTDRETSAAKDKTE